MLLATSPQLDAVIHTMSRLDDKLATLDTQIDELELWLPTKSGKRYKADLARIAKIHDTRFRMREAWCRLNAYRKTLLNKR
jgi:hypothetical protein